MIKKLGRGSYCSVWLAYNYVSSSFNAIKVYNRCDYKRGKREIKVFDNLKSKKISNIITYNCIANYWIIKEEGFIALNSIKFFKLII